MPVAQPEIVAVRTLIEEAQSSGGADADRVRKLRRLRADVTDLLGLIDSYVGGIELGREAAAITRRRDLIRARARADAREQLLAKGELTEAQADQLGYLSHDRLDALEREGRLEEALAQVPREAA